MGNVYSPYVTDLQTAGKRVPSSLLMGKSRLFPFKTTFASAGSGPVFYMTKVPPGMRLFGGIIKTDGLSSSGGVNLVMDLGDSGDPDRHIAALDLDVAQVTPLVFRIGTDLGGDYIYTADTWIIGTITGTPTDTSLWGFLVGVQE